MKKAFSMIELIVAMLILAFVFSVVPMILATTFSNTKTMLNQDKAIKLGELYSVLKLLPYQGAQNSNDVYNTNPNFTLESQNRSANLKLADEFLGDSDKFLIKPSNNKQKNYVGQNLKESGTEYIFQTGYGKEVIFELNSHSNSGSANKWDLSINNGTTLGNNVTISNMIIFNHGDSETNGVSVTSYFANTGRKNSHFYNELLPFTDNGSSIATIYEQQLKSLGVVIK